MDTKKISLLWTFVLFLPSLIWAQIHVSYPFDGAVFQRNTSNQANISIGGSYTSAVDRIEARVVAVAGGITTAWTTIDAAPSGGLFRGFIFNVTGGWYSLELRAVLFNNVTHTTSLSRVGVGEVLMIAGQSNGQGLYNFGSLPSSDANGRVRYVPWLLDCPNATCPNAEPPFPQIADMNGNAGGLSIAPNGRSTWAYAELGDALISRYSVPVIFFNAAADGSSVGNWSRSADGLPSAHAFLGTQFANNPNFPYYGLRKALNYYGNMFGVRAVLWHQGESDNLKNHNGNPFDNTSDTEYRDSLLHVINQSRNHSAKSNLAWVVARASYLAAPFGGPTDANVIAGQNLIINAFNKIFTGP
ncbi:MAG: T9SS C-terminal target domain-containing protein, partial [Spirosomaceae bacterium]|nr:T9SS C-terminal target domain-containing protein [Spirosomataceae bacterium]